VGSLQKELKFHDCYFQGLITALGNAEKKMQIYKAGAYQLKHHTGGEQLADSLTLMWVSQGQLGKVLMRRGNGGSGQRSDGNVLGRCVAVGEV
jgi:hypothetical protein